MEVKNKCDEMIWDEKVREGEWECFTNLYSDLLNGGVENPEDLQNYLFFLLNFCTLLIFFLLEQK